MSNILVTGVNGQLGQEIKALSSDYKNYSFVFANRATLDIRDFNAVELFAQQHNISAIINCAAYTAVDQAEDDVITADLINHQSVTNLGRIAKKFNLKLVHISTDYVFSGTAFLPYSVNENTSPKSVYGKTKLEGEQSLIDLELTNTIIIRTAWVYSEFGSNFVKTMLRLGQEREQLGIIYDQIGSPTYARDLAKAILDVLPNIATKTVEIYHYTNEGVCSWYDFAKAIFDIKDISCNVSAIPSSAYPTKATRPHYSVLDKEKIKKEFDLEIPYWKDSLRICLEKL